MEIRTVQAPGAPPPAGHYAPAVVYNGLVFVSGQLPIDPRTAEKQLGSVEEQTALVMANLRELLLGAGSDLSRLLKVTVYVADITLWDTVNRVYAEALGDHRPARAVVPTGPLHHGFLVEIDAIAAVG